MRASGWGSLALLVLGCRRFHKLGSNFGGPSYDRDPAILNNFHKLGSYLGGALI